MNPVRPSDTHIPDLELASLAEPGGRRSPTEAQARHLLTCRRCFAVYAEFAHNLTAHEFGAEEEVPRSWLRRGKAIETAPPSGLRRLRTPAWAPTAVAAACLCFLFLGWPGGDSASPVYEAIIQAGREDSRFGLVHMDVGEPATVSAIVYRSGNRVNRTAVRADLDRLSRHIADRGPDRDSAYWHIVGHLALAELDMAHSLIDEARARYPQDERFPLLAAHLAYKQSDLRQAHTLLAALHARQPENAIIQFNLGLVLREVHHADDDDHEVFSTHLQ